MHTERNAPKWRILYRKFINKFVDGYAINGVLTLEYLRSLGINNKNIATGVMAADSYNLANAVHAMNITEKQDIRQKIKLNDGLTYLYVGQMVERKGVNYLLMAWEAHTLKYPNDNLLLVGTGILLEQYEQQFEVVDSIHFIGSIDYSTIYYYYAIADIFVIPTLEDNWSLVVPEAMACGLPIACSKYNGCYPELVKENGRVFDPLNLNDTVQTLAYFHTIDLKQAGALSIEIEKEYSPEKAAKRTYELFDNLCKVKNVLLL
jgi:glycosyltransferase involved in cell wall biosynthesis